MNAHNASWRTPWFAIKKIRDGSSFRLFPRNVPYSFITTVGFFQKHCSGTDLLPPNEPCTRTYIYLMHVYTISTHIYIHHYFSYTYIQKKNIKLCPLSMNFSNFILTTNDMHFCNVYQVHKLLLLYQYLLNHF